MDCPLLPPRVPITALSCFSLQIQAGDPAGHHRQLWRVSEDTTQTPGGGSLNLLIPVFPGRSVALLPRGQRGQIQEQHVVLPIQTGVLHPTEAGRAWSLQGHCQTLTKQPQVPTCPLPWPPSNTSYPQCCPSTWLLFCSSFPLGDPGPIRRLFSYQLLAAWCLPAPPTVQLLPECRWGPRPGGHLSLVPSSPIL